jgi:myosin-15
VSIEKAKEKVVRDRDELERTSRAVAGINHLEIPAELAFILSKLEGITYFHENHYESKIFGFFKFHL